VSAVTIRAVGDTMLGDSHLTIGTGVRSLVRRRGAAYLFDAVRPHLAAGDALLFGNLECALSADRRRWRHRPFVGDLESAAALQVEGFGVLALATNHIYEQGNEPAIETEHALADLGIAAVGLPGSGGPKAFVEHGGVRIGFLSHSFVRLTAPDPFEHDAGIVFREAEALVGECDLAIISLHWGAEFMRVPSKEQIAYARALVRAGVRFVIGHHPHTMQPVEIFEGGVIAYSLGNFIFDMGWVPWAEEGLMVTATIPLDKSAAPSVGVLPLRTDESFRPVPVGEEVPPARFNESIEAGLDMDLLLQRPRDMYGPKTWEVRRRASKSIRAHVRGRPFRVPPATWWHLARKRLGGKKAPLDRAQVDAAWTLETP